MRHLQRGRRSHSQHEKGASIRSARRLTDVEECIGGERVVKPRPDAVLGAGGEKVSHHVAGRAVQLAEDQGVSLSQLSLEDIKSLHKEFKDDVMAVWDFNLSVERRDSTGGTSRRSVLEQVSTMRKWLKSYESSSL